jgi:hypothetical protein
MTIREMIQDHRTRREFSRHSGEWTRWCKADHYGTQKGNPPKSPQLDAEIDIAAGEYPEVSVLEDMQALYNGQCREEGIQYGPGRAEPPHDADLREADREAPEWTFTQWAQDRDFDPELVDQVNAEFPADPREEEYRQSREYENQRQIAEWEREVAEWQEPSSPKADPDKEPRE